MIDAASHIQFTASQQGESFAGTFKRFAADINFNPQDLTTAHVKAVIDLGSVQAGDKDRDGALPGKDWFYTQKFPEAVFEADRFTHMGDDQYKAEGTLTLKGATHSLTLPFALSIADGMADMNAQITLDRTIWGIGSGSWASGEWVSTSVDVEIKISAKTG